MRSVLLGVLCCAVSLVFAEDFQFQISADRENCLYACGEEAVFQVKAVDQKGALVRQGKVSWRLDNFGARQQGREEIDLSKSNPFSVKGTLKEPGFLRLTLQGEGKRPKVFGVGYEPHRIEQGRACPADFDQFWAAAMKHVEETVPLDPKMEWMKEIGGKINVYRVSFATVGNRRVHGYLSVPKQKRAEPYPVCVTVPGAGCGGYSNNPYAPANQITLFMSVFPFEPNPDLSVVNPLYAEMNRKYKEQYGVPTYASAGIAVSREAYFYYPVILGINRAVNWLAKRPDVDLKRFVYQGTSQGGGFGFFLCGLNRHFTKAGIFVPAITDLYGYQKGRQSGWPRIIENQPERQKAAAEKNAAYFDGVNFAARIHIPVRVVVGFADTTCAPCAVYSAYRVIPSKDKDILHGIGMTHGVYGKLYHEVNLWLNRPPAADQK